MAFIWKCKDKNDEVVNSVSSPYNEEYWETMPQDPNLARLIIQGKTIPVYIAKAQETLTDGSPEDPILSGNWFYKNVNEKPTLANNTAYSGSFTIPTDEHWILMAARMYNGDNVTRTVYIQGIKHPGDLEGIAIGTHQYGQYTDLGAIPSKSPAGDSNFEFQFDVQTLNPFCMTSAPALKAFFWSKIIMKVTRKFLGNPLTRIPFVGDYVSWS